MYIPRRIHLDFETFAQPRGISNEIHGRIIDGVDLVRDGIWNYSRHPLTGCYLFGAKLDGLPTFVVQLWKRLNTPTGYHWQLKTLEELLAQYPPLISFLAGIAAGVPVVAHNSAFERLINNNVLRRYHGGWPELKLSQQVCTMARANAMSLPAGLENLANVLGLKNRKGDSTLMKLLAMSAPNVSAAVTPEALEELGAYCAQDVETEAEIDHKLYPLSASQRELWILDQEINGRGIPVDVVAIRRALKVVDAARELANARLAELTGGKVKTAQRNAALAGWLRDQGHPSIVSVAAFTLECHGEDVGWTPADKAGTAEGVAARELIEEVLELREVASRSSVAKLRAVLDQLRLTDDARVRHQYTVFGAGTGRWCLTGDHEVLTPKGWRRLDAWSGGRIACWSEDGKVSFESALSNAFPYAGEMVEWANTRFQQIATPDHRMPVAGIRGGIPVDEIQGRHRIPRTGLTECSSRYTECALRFFVMLQADGHYAKGGVLSFRFKKARKVTRCLQLLKWCGSRFNIAYENGGVTRIQVPREEVQKWMLDLGPDKEFPWELLYADHNIFFEELEFWDGYPCGPSSTQYSTCNKHNSDFVQAKCHMSGRSCNILIKERNDKPNWNICYVCNIWHAPSTSDIRKQFKNTLSFDGTVFCPSTPTGYFIARRNGVAWITGNTGRGFQPQNMQRFDSEGEQENADKLFAILNDDVFWGSAETPGEFLQAAGMAARRIQEETGQNAIKLIGKCMRIFVKAPEAK